MAAKPCNAATYRRATVDLALLKKPQIIVEVGVYAGGLSQLLSAIPTVRSYTIVDSWAGGYSGFDQAHMDNIAAEVFGWAEDHSHVTILRMDSAVAADLTPDGSVDFFHTDGDHSLPGISGDIANWLPKVRPGGIMSGDNYEDEIVAQGVDAAFGSRVQIGAKGRLWWVRV